MTERVQREQPDLLSQLLGGGGGASGGGGLGGLLASPIGKAALSGIVAIAAQRLLGGRR